MKKQLIFVLAIMALVLCVSSVSAAVTVESNFGGASATFGGENVMASNSKAEADSKIDVYKNSGAIVINNTGSSAVTITSAEVVTYYEDFDATDLDITLVSSDSIVTGAVGNVVLNGRIPDKLDSVNSDLEVAAIKVATVRLTASDGSTVDFDAYMQRKNMLELVNIDVDVAGDTDDYDDGDEVEDIRPGQSIIVDIELENLYSDDEDEDLDVENVDIEVDLDSDFDVDEPDKEDLSPEEELVFTVDIYVEEDASDATSEMTVRIEAEDELGAKHGLVFTLDMEVVRISKDVMLKEFSLRESQMSCTGGENEVSVRMYNRGDRDQDEIMLTIEGKDVGIDFSKQDIVIDEDDTVTKNVYFTVPSSLAAGTYVIRASGFYENDDNDLAFLEDIELEVKACPGAIPVTTAPNNVQVTDGQQQVTVPESVLEEFGIIETVDEGSFTDSTAFIVILTVLVTLALAGIITAIILLILKS